MLESHFHSEVAPGTEFFRSDIALNRQTARVRLQVLPDSHDIARDGAQIFHQFDNFMKNLAVMGGLAFVLSFGPGPVSIDRGGP